MIRYRKYYASIGANAKYPSENHERSPLEKRDFKKKSAETTKRDRKKFERSGKE